MKKALIYTLAVALLLSLAACHKSQTGQQTTEPEPPQVQATIPEAEPISEPEPEEIPAVPELLSEDIPAESNETEDSQTPEEAEGMGVIDPDNTPADVYSSDGLTEQEQEELQQRFQEEVHVDETLPEVTEQDIKEQEDKLENDIADIFGGLNIDMSGADYSPESTLKSYTDGWTAVYD